MLIVLSPKQLQVALYELSPLVNNAQSIDPVYASQKELKSLKMIAAQLHLIAAVIEKSIVDNPIEDN